MRNVLFIFIVIPGLFGILFFLGPWAKKPPLSKFIFPQKPAGIPASFWPALPQTRPEAAGGRPGVLPACGQALTRDMALDRDMDCRGQAALEVFSIAESDLVIDCQGHTIIAPENALRAIGADHVNNIGIFNCEIIGGNSGIHLNEVQGAVLYNNIIHGFSSCGLNLKWIHRLILSHNHVFSEGEAAAGIELFSSEDGLISDNNVHGFRLGGIQFYGSSRMIAIKNRVHGIGDTCFGFFDDKKSTKRTHHVSLWDNEAHDCKNIGACEIMFGSHHLYFFDNYFHDSGCGLAMYDPVHQDVNRLEFAGNRIENCLQGASLFDNTRLVRFRSNHFIDNAFGIVVGKSNRIRITDNVFQLQKRIPDSKTMLLYINHCTDLTFTGNTIEKYPRMVDVGDGWELNLKENYWGGCPESSDFLFPGREIQDVINPIDLDPLPESQRLYFLSPSDLSGNAANRCDFEAE